MLFGECNPCLHMNPIEALLIAVSGGTYNYDWALKGYWW